jgi:hypothetical protein
MNGRLLLGSFTSKHGVLFLFCICRFTGSLYPLEEQKARMSKVTEAVSAVITADGIPANKP